MKPTRMFECGACHTLHPHPTLARQCCLPLVFEAFVCTACGRNHRRDESAAAVCCTPAMYGCDEDCLVADRNHGNYAALVYGD